ncbi:hypothetical protein FA15DRAFT_658982 [Coprinopsis marcescibilis]|uniref:Uncharacterized protein n=1 Tax=Coprinopsis marcescibilis TaxID=230819 RepID=A0A5C3KJS9_COPMA|nr:hypothetical protein FA15DRAFT_658982 [Coprinopsis marcescibilis]
MWGHVELSGSAQVSGNRLGNLVSYTAQFAENDPLRPNSGMLSPSEKVLYFRVSLQILTFASTIFKLMEAQKTGSRDWSAQQSIGRLLTSLREPMASGDRHSQPSLEASIQSIRLIRGFEVSGNNLIVDPSRQGALRKSNQLRTVAISEFSESVSIERVGGERLNVEDSGYREEGLPRQIRLDRRRGKSDVGVAVPRTVTHPSQQLCSIPGGNPYHTEWRMPYYAIPKYFPPVLGDRRIAIAYSIGEDE